MSKRSPMAVLGAILVVALAILCGGVIAIGFIMPEQLFDSALGVGAMFGATIVMVGCAIVANLYDLRGILLDASGERLVLGTGLALFGET